MNAPSVDIKEMLEAGSLELYYNDNLYIGTEPPLPADCVTIFDTAGRGPQMLLDPENDGYEYPSVQIRVRNIDYLTGWTLIENIKALLHGKHQETWNSTLYSVIYCASGPALLDKDDKGNCRFIINFNIERR